MSEVAGRLAPQVGAHALMRAQGGRGVLLGGVPGVPTGRRSSSWARGVSGQNAMAIAVGMQADMSVLDLSIGRLRQVDTVYQGRVHTISSNAFEIERAVLDADLVIGAVLVPGAKAPTLATNDMVAAHEARLGAGGYLDRPGRLLRGLSAHDSR